MANRSGIERNLEALGPRSLQLFWIAMMTNESNQPFQHRPVVSTTRARGGVTGQKVRYVLIFGLLAVIIAFAIIYAAFFAH